MDKLSPNWLSEDLADARMSIMAAREKGGPFAQGMDGEVLSDTDKHQLLMRLEARFKGWAGESIAAFKARALLQQSETAHVER